MNKTIYTREYAVLLKHLVATRKRAGVTQAELARRLGQHQSYVSKCESGERRIDVIELRAFCNALEVSFCKFVKKVAEAIS